MVAPTLMAGSSTLFSTAFTPSRASAPVVAGVRALAVRVFRAVSSRPFSVSTCFFANQRLR